MFEGRVYKLEFQDGYFYIGSTKQKMSYRITAHRNWMKYIYSLYKDKEYPGHNRFEYYICTYGGWTTPTITILQTCSVETIAELQNVEALYIRQEMDNPKMMNRHIPAYRIDGVIVERFKVIEHERKPKAISSQPLPSQPLPSDAQDT